MNIGIIGTGSIARTICKTLNTLKDPEIVLYACASRREEKSKLFAEENNIKHFYGSYEAMLKDPNVDLVYIATPHSEHYKHIKMSLEHNKNVLCEKPLCVNYKQAEAMFKLAEEKNLLLQEAFWTRFTPASRYLKTLMASFNNISQVKITFGMYLKHIKRLSDPSLAGGALLDLGVYPISMAMNLLGNECQLTDLKYHLLKTGVDKDDDITLIFNNKTIVNIRISMAKPMFSNFTLKAENGSLRVKGINLHKKAEVNFNNHVTKVNFNNIVNGYEYQFIKVKEALKNNLLQCQEMTKEDSLAILKVLDEIRKKENIVYPFEKLNYGL